MLEFWLDSHSVSQSVSQSRAMLWCARGVCNQDLGLVLGLGLRFGLGLGLEFSLGLVLKLVLGVRR